LEDLKAVKKELEDVKKILVDILKLSKSIIRTMRKVTQSTAQMTGYVSDSTTPWSVREEEETTTYTFLRREDK